VILTKLGIMSRAAFEVFGSDDVARRTANEVRQLDFGVNAALAEMANAANLTQLRREGSIQLAKGQDHYELPDRTVSVVQGSFRYDDDRLRCLRFVSHQEVIQLGLHRDQRTGQPEFITDVDFDADAMRWVIRVYPTPGEGDESRRLLFRFNESPRRLDEDGDIPPLPENLHEYLIYGTVVLGFPSYITTDRVLGAFYQSRWDKGLQTARRKKDVLTGRKSSLRASTGGQGRIHPLLDQANVIVADE